MGGSPNGSLYGYFVIPRDRPFVDLRIISSGATHKGELGEWEHVSVSLAHRCPTWDEMCFVKDLFWMSGECVIQFHPPKSDYINAMPYCLHLWKPIHAIELPPSMTLGISKKAKRRALAKALVR